MLQLATKVDNQTLALCEHGAELRELKALSTSCGSIPNRSIPNSEPVTPLRAAPPGTHRAQQHDGGGGGGGDGAFEMGAARTREYEGFKISERVAQRYLARPKELERTGYEARRQHDKNCVSSPSDGDGDGNGDEDGGQGNVQDERKRIKGKLHGKSKNAKSKHQDNLKQHVIQVRMRAEAVAVG